MRIDSSGNVGIGTTTVGQIFTTDVGLTVIAETPTAEYTLLMALLQAH